MRRISWITILAALSASLLSSCVTPPEYIYVYPDPAHLPSIDEVISVELRRALSDKLDLVREPATVGDILHNMNEYQQAYLLQLRYSAALEDYIDDIITIHNGQGVIKDGTDVSV